MKTRLTQQFGIRHPILCAPMAWIAGGRLVAAVSDAGGLGILGGGYAGALGGEPDLDEELALAKGRKFGVGFITWALDGSPQALEQALKHCPYCVFLSFGEPKPYAKKIRDAKAKLICQVQTLRHVEQALDAGADGVLVGTRFWASAEALTPAAMLDRAVRATGDDTVRTKAIDALRGVPWPQEFSFRVLKNKFTDEWAHREAEAALARGSLRSAYAEARAKQDLDMYLTVVGEATGLLHDRPSAASLVEDMVAQAESLLKRGASLDFDAPRARW